MNVSSVILIVAAATTALMAGLFYAWSCSVMPGFARLSDEEFVAAMRACNRAIQNPIFFAAFFGAPVFLTISAVLHYGQTTRFWFLLAATGVYLIGTFGVTVFGNVPLNNRLERFDADAATAGEVAAQRANFESRWTNLNWIRAVSSTLAVILVTAACLD